MTARDIILMLTELQTGTDKMEIANNVLNELYVMKETKGLPGLVVKKAIKIQENIIKNL